MGVATQLQANEVDSYEEAIQLANEINRLEAALKQMKDELKTFVKDYGAVDTGEEVWNFYESISWKFSNAELKEIAREMALDGVDPWSMFSISKSNINKLGWEEQRLSQLGTKKVTQRFTSRKKK
ncbi:hypothetical protein CIL03_08590 [Virgibacillus indicus]|uniref:Uncharacterized protein n=1 Tax=Virgibacillus indicus TaxID=2024554 RepID=A0A265NAN8_9BACI|nr:hypothetical protein [Virgibacillus indicus]OZU89063.1 hypothetical protein CIL03_08590 [Virgibacillus indicus]